MNKSNKGRLSLSRVNALGILISTLSIGNWMIIPTLAQAESNPTNQIAQMGEVKPNEVETEPTETETPSTVSPTETPATSSPTETPTSSSPQTLAQIATETEQLNTFTTALKAAELQDMLAQEGPYTIFAPTDAAFRQLPQGTLDKLLNPDNRELLKQLLRYHIVSNKLMVNDLETGTLEALGGGLAIQESEYGTIINNATIVKENMEASNGVIHLINRVLVPENFGESLGLTSEPTNSQPTETTEETPSAPTNNQPTKPTEETPLKPSGETQQR